MKIGELREITPDELAEHIRTQRRELFGLRFQHATGELENTAGLSTAKRDLARALTVARERDIDPEDLMAEENDTTPEETPEETPAAETPVEETPAVEEPAAEEPAAEEPAAEEPAAEEPAAEEPAAEEPAAEEPAAEEPAAEVEAAAPPTKKEKRREARHAEASKRAPRTAAERQAERDAERARKAAQRRRRREKAKAARPAERGPAKTASTAEHGPGRPKVRLGRVVSDKADKTITIKVDMARRHRRYEKIVRSRSTLHAHDERNEAHEGDLVRVVESRPLSRSKRWRLVEVLERAE